MPLQHSTASDFKVKGRAKNVHADLDFQRAKNTSLLVLPDDVKRGIRVL
jgi:hypothetical protein